MHYSSDRRGYRKKRKIRYTHDNSRSGRRNRISFAGFLERTISVLILILAILSVDIFGALFLICRGPSEKARDLFVSTVTQPSAAGILAHLLLTDDEVTAILAKEESTGSMTGAISLQKHRNGNFSEDVWLRLINFIADIYEKKW